MMLEPHQFVVVQELLPAATATWRPLSNWRVSGVRTGVRALPPRTPQGSIPLLGSLKLPGLAAEACSKDVQTQHSTDSWQSATSKGSPADGAASTPRNRGAQDVVSPSASDTVKGDADAEQSPSQDIRESGIGSAQSASTSSSSSDNNSRTDSSGSGVASTSTIGISSGSGSDALPPCWVFTGLGARGLVYHAWLGRLIAEAVVSGSEEGLPPETLAWKRLMRDTRDSLVFDSS